VTLRLREWPSAMGARARRRRRHGSRHRARLARLIAVAAAFAFALLAIEYALFTTEITSLVVLLSHALGQSAWSAADERAIATLLGIATAAAAAAIAVAVRRRSERPPASRIGSD
jgi:uncharacterized membrane protein YccC